MVPVSVLILTKNEERNIADCINSCSFADEIIVIDDESEDRTVKIAKSLGARVIRRPLNNDWGGQQTFAIQQAKHDWVFLIDADERCTDALAKEIEMIINKGEKFACHIKRKNLFKHYKCEHGIVRPDFVCRLMPKEGSYVKGFVHQEYISPYPKKKLTNHMYHYTYDNWNQYFAKINKYTTLSALKFREQGKSSNFVFDVLIRPWLGFIKMYIIHLGFLDGKLGFIFSVSHAFYTFIKYVKFHYLLKSDGKL